MSSGPYPAFRGTICNNCDESVNEGDKIYIVSDEKLCESCAEDSGYVCHCGNYKGDNYSECYTCNSVKIFPTKGGDKL